MGIEYAIQCQNCGHQWKAPVEGGTCPKCRSLKTVTINAIPDVLGDAGKSWVGGRK